MAAGAGDRAKTTKSIFGITITNGIIGNFTINSTGDTNLTPITIYKQAGKQLDCSQDDHPGGEPGRRVTKAATTA